MYNVYYNKDINIILFNLYTNSINLPILPNTYIIISVFKVLTIYLVVLRYTCIIFVLHY